MLLTTLVLAAYWSKWSCVRILTLQRWRTCIAAFHQVHVEACAGVLRRVQVSVPLCYMSCNRNNSPDLHLLRIVYECIALSPFTSQESYGLCFVSSTVFQPSVFCLITNTGSLEGPLG
jgi:hypothetical protein